MYAIFGIGDPFIACYNGTFGLFSGLWAIPISVLRLQHDRLNQIS